MPYMSHSIIPSDTITLSLSKKKPNQNNINANKETNNIWFNKSCSYENCDVVIRFLEKNQGLPRNFSTLYENGSIRIN
jgi:hypothetical protein